MDPPITYYGFVFVGSRAEVVEKLEGNEAIVAFLKAHIYDEEVRITDELKKRVLFHSRDGVDLLSSLHLIGISLPEIYKEVKQRILTQSQNDESERQDWEDNYDSIGLSPEEILMRQVVKRQARGVETVADVARMVGGDSDFDAFFNTEDHTRAWSYFDPDSLTVTPMKHCEDGGWTGDWGKSVRLKPEARVKHAGSGEDIHFFIIFDPPND